MANELLSRIEITATTTGLDKTAADLNDVKNAQQGVVSSSAELEKKNLSVERSFFRLQKQYDQNFKAEQELARVKAILAKAATQELGTYESRARLLDLVTNRLNSQSAANDNAAKSTRQTTQQFTNLGYQLNDIMTGLITGQSPLMIIGQQGGQVYQALNGPGGVSAGIKNVGSKLWEMASIAKVAGAVVIGTAVAGALAWSRFDDQQKSIATTLDGLGARAGLTSAQFMQMAQATAAANNLSVRQTTDLGLAYARTGKLGAENIELLIGVTKNYAATTGVSISDAKTELASLFSDPAGAIDKLQKQFALLDGTTRDQVESLLRQGRAQEAVKITLDKLPGSLANYNTSLGKISSGWEYLKEKVSDADRAVGKFLNQFLGTSSIEDRVKALTTRVADLKKAAELPAQPGAPPGQKSGMSVDAPTVASTTPPPPLSGRLSAANDLADTQRKLTMDQQALRRGLENEADRQLTQDLVDRADAVRSIAKELGNVNPEQKKYLDWEKALRDATTSTDPEFKRQIGNIDDVNVALDKASQRNKTYLDEEKRSAAARQIETDEVHAHTDAARADIAQRKARLDVAGQAIKGTQAEATEQHAYNMVLDESNEKLRLQIRDQRMAADVVDLERKMIGANASERESALAGLEAEQKLTRDGVDISNELAKSYIAQAKANAVRKAELEKARITHDISQERDTVFLSDEDKQITQRLKPLYGDKYQEALKSAEAGQIRTTNAIGKAWGDAKSAVSDFASSFANDMAHGVKAAEALANAAKKVGDSLISGGMKSIVEGVASQNWLQAGIGAAEVGGGFLLNAVGPSEKSKQRKQQMQDAWTKSQQDQLDAIQKQQEAVIQAGIDSAKASEEAAKEATKKAEDAQRRIEGFQDRAVMAGVDTSTTSGQLAAFDLQAQREREDEIRSGGEAIADLEMALAAEREKIVRDGVNTLLQEEKRRFDEAKQFLEQFAKTIKQFLDNLSAGSQSTLSPQDRLTAAQTQFETQRSLAQGGDRDALSGITGYANNLLDAAKSFYGSTSGYQDILSMLTSQLSALPTQVAPEQLIVDAIQSQTGTLVDAFSSIDINNDDLISRQEASNTWLSSIFNELDVNGDGQISRLELIRYHSEGIDWSTDYINDYTSNTNAIINGLQTIAANQLADLAHLEYIRLRTEKTSNNAARTASNTMWSANKDSGSSIGLPGDFTFAQGGWVSGTGTGMSDSIAALLSNGEFVVRASQAREYAPQLEAINSGRGLNDNDAVVSEVRMLRAELTQLRGDVKNVSRATALGAQHVREGVEGVRDSHIALVREQKRRAA